MLYSNIISQYILYKYSKLSYQLLKRLSIETEKKTPTIVFIYLNNIIV